MDLTLNEHQMMLQSTVRDLRDREFTKASLVAIDAGTERATEHWSGLSSTGILGSLIPEEYGGVGA